MRQREIVRLVAPKSVTDGAGVRIRRLIGTPELDHVDPFLLFDEFGSERGADYIKGFPPHPHRGFETVTYMLEGRMRHEDNHGRSGDLGPGDVQWMTAGRGIIHSEMPQQEDGLMRGFQIWVNLPRSHKMAAPRYQDIPASAFSVVAPSDGIKVKVIAGRFHETEGAVRDIVAEPLYLDIALEAGARLDVPVPAGHSAIAFTHRGRAFLGGNALAEGHLAVLGDGDHLQINAEEDAALILLAARPFREPVVRHGPFVMNSRDEIVQAIEDYQSGRF